MKIWTKKAPSFPSRRWMEALPLGNGITSAMLFGSVGTECININRFDRWEGGDADFLPDVSEDFRKMQDSVKRGEYKDANFILCNALRDKGYNPVYPPVPSVPYEFRITFTCKAPFSKYRRGIDLEKGEAFVTYHEGDAKICRRAFVSMADDIVAYRCTSDAPFTVKLSIPESLSTKVTFVGGVKKEVEGATLIEDTNRIEIMLSFGSIPNLDYDTLFERHLAKWKDAMGEATLSLCKESDTHNEALIEDNNDNGISAELVEKLWRWGRYLFVSGTSESGYPFPLYGLWCGEKDPMWAQNVANENVQIIYQHTSVGGLSHLVKPLIHYYFNQMDKCREAARKLFGCRGIFVSVYSTPVSTYPSPNVPVIINYISAAPWLCRHFWEYYVYTGDEELLRSEILPFMLETAAFFEDYITRENGKVEIIPSVSPENSPKNLIGDSLEKVGFTHPCPVVKNSTMDYALLKELLTNLSECAKSHTIDESRVALWREILFEIPEYKVNRDGAVSEWISDDLEDYYRHRHLSHIYPLFPGNEIGKDSPLLCAFEKACDMRELGGFAGWTYPHMSAVYSRLGRGEDALSMLEGLVKYCMTENFLSLGFDYCDRGSWSEGTLPATVQLDGVTGAVAAVQEMLFRVRGDELYILPALPERLGKGSLKNWSYPKGKIDITWNKSEGKIDITLHGCENYKIICPDWYNKG